MSSLAFRVVFCTNEDSEYRAEELNEHTPTTKGWQSTRISEREKDKVFPIELGFELEGEAGARLSQIQLLSHQAKISSKIEIFIGSGNEYNVAEFKRLGYLSLDSNERSSYQARELKTVYIDQTGKFIKLLVHVNHPNKLNSGHQVGIVALNLIGIEEPYSKAPAISSLPVSRSPQRNIGKDLASELSLDSNTASKLRFLSEAKAQAIADEDYNTAKMIKTVEVELKSLGSRLAQIDQAKREAVRLEDYDKAAGLKDESRELRALIEQKIKDINIPGMPAAGSGAARGRPLRVGGPVDEVPVQVASIPGYDSDGPPVSARRRSLEAPLSARGGYDSKRSPDKHGPGSGDSYGEEVGGDQGEEYEGEGSHPLEGIANHHDLPAPEPLTGKPKEFSDQAGITNLIGEYRARCLFSKVWGLREAVLNKVRLLVEEEFEPDIGLAQCINPLCAIVRVGVDDKLSQLMFSAIPLLEYILQGIKRDKLSRSSISPALEPVVTSLLEKLNDGAARVRETALKSIMLIAGCSSIGPLLVGSRALAPIQGKQKGLWRPLVGRLQVLTELVGTYGLAGSTGLSHEGILNFCKQAGAFAHNSGEVREACKELCVALHALVGADPIVEPYLAPVLRPKQIEEYLTAFERNGGAPVVRKTHPEDKVVAKQPSLDSHNNINGGRRAGATGGQSQQQKGAAKGSSAHNTPRSQPPLSHREEDRYEDDAEGGDEEAPDFTTCMFCGKSDKRWNEDALDLHYWRDCPLLSPCPACAQVVEIAGLPEHLVEECDAKDDYTLCDITGLAILKADYEAWRASAKCKPAPAECMYCPLCRLAVEDSDEAWKIHLVQGCPNNKRTSSATGAAT